MSKSKQVKVKYIENFPRIPNPYHTVDWKSLAQDFTAVIFNEKLEGEYLPLLKLSETETFGYCGEMFALPSYIGQEQEFGEALTCIGSVFGASLSGTDMSNYNNRNFVAMCEAYYASINGHGLVLNNVNVKNSCGSFWYDIFPSCLFYHLGALYPENELILKKMKEIAESWLDALPALYGNWDHTGFSFKDMDIVDSGKWIEPDAAIGIAYIEYMAYLKWGEVKFLEAAKKCMQEMEKYAENPYYEILGSYGPYLAARMNSEENMKLSVGKFLQYIFDSTSSARPGWGVINERWGNDDAYGLSGSTTDTSGYAFSMNTYTTAGLIAPMVRYSPEYSRAIGRYLLHVSSNSRLYFPDKISPEMQSDYDWYKVTKVNCISYEGVRNKGLTTPYSTGDTRKPFLNFNPYGAWGVGIMAAMYDNTQVDGILKVDVLKTDFEHGPAYPTYLYYNPFDEAKKVDILLDEQESDLYDCVSKGFIARSVKHKTFVTINPDEALLIVIVPSAGKITWDHEKMLIDDVVVDFKGKYQYYDNADIEIPSYNLALKKTVKASSEKNSEYGAGNVVEADWRTRWKSAEVQTQWIYVDLQDVYRINKINLRWYDLAHAVSYKIQVSQNGDDWKDVYTTNSGDGYLDSIKLDVPAKGRFVRLYCMDKEDRNTYSLIEFEVYGSLV
ncbi:MAG: discoidin domain-containing protein [Bacillota bacterium]|nr:discoidin domain-containing protein [Bacillota bacterium]